MYALAHRWTSSSPLFAAALTVFGITLLAATLLDGIYLYWALVVTVILVIISAMYPERMLLTVIAVSMLVPVDLAIKFGPLPRIGPTRVLLAAFIIGIVLRALGGGISGTLAGRMPLRNGILLFLAAAAVSSAFSVEPLKSAYTMVSLGVEQFLMFWVLYIFLRTPGFWGRLKTTVFIVTACICLLAFYEELSRNSIMLRVYPDEYLDFRGGILRVRSTFFHPIALACCLNMVYPFAVTDFMKQQDFPKKLALGALVVLIITTVLLTVSRGPLLALILETFVLLAWWARKHVMNKAALAAGAAVLAACLTFGMVNEAPVMRSLGPFVNPNAISLGRISEDSSEYYRIALAKAVIDRMEGERLIIGSGPGTFFLADIKSAYAGHNHVLTAPDSSVFKLLFEYGILGTCAFCVLVFLLLRTCLGAVRSSGTTGDPEAYACLAAVAGFLWANITVSMFSLLPLAILFWMSVAVAFSLAGQREGDQFAGDVNGTDKPIWNTGDAI